MTPTAFKPATALDKQLAGAKTQRERKAKRAATEPVEQKQKQRRPWDYTGRYKQGGAR